VTGTVSARYKPELIDDRVLEDLPMKTVQLLAAALVSAFAPVTAGCADPKSNENLPLEGTWVLKSAT
jgi:hypothetical protein